MAGSSQRNPNRAHEGDMVESSRHETSPTHRGDVTQTTGALTSQPKLSVNRRAKPSNIIVPPTAPNIPSKRNRDKFGEGDTTDPKTAPQYNTRSRRKLQHQPDDKQITGFLEAPSLLLLSEPAPKSIPKPPFRLLDRIMKHPEIILRLASIIEVRSLVDLYAISKPFHFIMNSHFTTYIRCSTNIHAPDSGYIFPWRCYRRLTIKDPGFRENDAQLPRDVPSLLWLQMVSHRHKATVQIIQKMNEAGHHFFGRVENTQRAIKKIWFLMDLARNGARIGVIHNASYWTDHDIFTATLFLIKLDMRFTDPVEGTGETALRKLMLGQRSLYQLRDLLMGKLNKLKLLKMWVLYDWTTRPETAHLPTLGIPPHLVGRGCLEMWGQGTERLLRPDELLVREAVRRKLDLHLKYVDMLRYGYLMQTSKALPKSGTAKLKDRRPMDEYVAQKLDELRLATAASAPSSRNQAAREQAQDEAELMAIDSGNDVNDENMADI